MPVPLTRLLASVLLAAVIPTAFAGSPRPENKPPAEIEEAANSPSLANYYYTGAFGKSLNRIEISRSVQNDFRRGYEYETGKGRPIDLERAVTYYRRAADGHHPNAQFALAVMLETGKGVTPNLAEAAELYEQAALSGHVQAQFNLALMYAHGAGRAADNALAQQWYTEAAKRGLMPAQHNLALLLAAKADTEQAYTWLTIASKGGDATVLRSRDAIGATLSEQQRASAVSRAEAWKPAESM